MTEPNPAAQSLQHEVIAHPPGSVPGPLFPPEEWRLFRTSDRTGATYIVGLMGGIFSVGLVLYLIVLWSVLS